MIWYIIRYTVFGIFVALTVYFVSKKKYEQLMWLYFFTFPFQNCAAFLITTWNPYKIVAIGMAFVMIFQPIKRKLPSELNTLTYWYVFLLLIGNIMALFMPAATAGAKGITRLLVQDVTYLLGFVPILFIKWLPVDFGKRIQGWYAKAICTLIVIGFIHYAFMVADIPFAPIIRDVGTTNEFAATQFGSGLVYRIYGLSGEPKNMAFALVPFVLLIMSKMLIGKEYGRKNWLLLICSLFILINTYSSAAYIEFIICVLAVAYIAVDLMNNQTKFTLISVLSLCVILVYAYSLVAPESNASFQPQEQQSFFDNFYERSFGRAQNELEEGRLETIILKDFIESNNLLYHLFGYGPGQYSFHSEGLVFGRGVTPVQSGLVLNLVDFGICGYLYFFYLSYFVCRIYIATRNATDKTALYFVIMGIAVLIGNMMYSMMGGCILIGMLPFIGIAYWINYNKREIATT